MKKADLRSVGRLLRAQGTGGELKYRQDADFALEPGMTVVVESRGGLESTKVGSVRQERGSRYLMLEGVSDLASAEALAGRDILVNRECLRHPAEGTFFTEQLIGCRVMTMSGQDIGLVREVIPVGESGLLIVEREGREATIPLAADICRDVRPEEGLIRIDPPDGLLDLDEI